MNEYSFIDMIQEILLLVNRFALIDLDQETNNLCHAGIEAHIKGDRHKG
jgi:hypothetical protein